MYTQPSFIYTLAPNNYGGFSFNPGTTYQLGLSTTQGAIGFGGFAKLYNSVLGSDDHYISFRLGGFLANQAFYLQPFGFMGPCLRAYGSTLSDFNETAPRTCYLARFNHVNLASTVNALTQVSTGTGTTSLLPGMTVLSAPITLLYTSASGDALYKFNVSGSVISLQQSITGAAFGTVLTYTDSSTGAIASGSPGFFSLAKPMAGGTGVNRWLLLDSIQYSTAGGFTSTAVKISTLYLKSGNNSSIHGDTVVTVTTPPSGSSTTLTWNDPTSSVVLGDKIGLPFAFGHKPPQIQPNRLGIILDWDPNGYHILDYSALLRLASTHNFSASNLYLTFTVQTMRNNFLAADFPNGYSRFEVGLSNSVTTTVRDSGNNDAAKIGFTKIKKEYVTFAQDNKSAVVRVPLSLIGSVFKSAVRTVYVKGAIRSNGLDGIWISDLTVGV